MTPRRITNAAPGSWTGVEYSSVNAFSAGNKYLILQHGGAGYGLYSGGDGEFIRELPHISHHAEPRWDSWNHNLYFISGNRMWKYSPEVDEVALLHQFSEYVDFTLEERNGVSGFGEGDIEGNLMALSGLRPTGQRDVFLFDVKQLRKGTVLALEPYYVHGLDQLYTSSGHVIIGWKAAADPTIPVSVQQFKGLEVYDSDMKFVRRLATVIAHMDVGTW